MKKLFAGFVSAITASICCSPIRAASHATPLFHAASEYQQAAHELGHFVIRSSFLNPYQQRVVQRLMESSNRLLAASRHPSSRDRFYSEWLEAQLRFEQVRLVILGDPGCPLTSPFAACADRFSCSYRTLAEQISLTPCLHPLPHWVDQRGTRDANWGEPGHYEEGPFQQRFSAPGIPLGRSFGPANQPFHDSVFSNGRTNELGRGAASIWPTPATRRIQQITRDPDSHGYSITPMPFHRDFSRLGSVPFRIPPAVIASRTARLRELSSSELQLNRPRPDWTDQSRSTSFSDPERINRPKGLGAKLQRVAR
jgi:hypothetical protein